MGKSKRYRKSSSSSSSSSPASSPKRYRRTNVERQEVKSRVSGKRVRTNASTSELRLSQEPPTSGNPEQLNNAQSVYEERFKQIEEALLQLSRQTPVSTNNLRPSTSTVRGDCIPEFTPENENITATKWVEKIDQIKAINNWDDVAAIYNMQARLTGMAKTWYHSLDSLNYSWAEWKQLIVKSFPDHVDYATALNTMLNRKKLPEENMTSYYFSKMELVRTCDISAKKAVSCVIHGIPDLTIQNAARAGRYENPETLYENYLSMLRNEPTEIVRESVAKPAHIHTRKLSSTRPDLRQQLTTKTKADLQNVTCFNCKGKGHFQSKCPKPKLVCTKCNLLGHDAERCRVSTATKWRSNRPNSSDKAEQVLSLSNTKLQNACYFIDCMINGESLRGYVDSGCAAVTLRESNANALKLAREPTLVRLCGYAGGSITSVSKVKINLKVDSAEAATEALVALDQVQDVPLIAGQPFVNNESVIVVVKSNQVQLFNKHVEKFSQINELLVKNRATRIELRVEETVVIPPNHVGFISVCHEGVGDVFID